MPQTRCHSRSSSDDELETLPKSFGEGDDLVVFVPQNFRPSGSSPIKELFDDFERRVALQTPPSDPIALVSSELSSTTRARQYHNNSESTPLDGSKRRSSSPNDCVISPPIKSMASMQFSFSRPSMPAIPTQSPARIAQTARSSPNLRTRFKSCPETLDDQPEANSTSSIQPKRPPQSTHDLRRTNSNLFQKGCETFFETPSQSVFTAGQTSARSPTAPIWDKSYVSARICSLKQTYTTWQPAQRMTSPLDRPVSTSVTLLPPSRSMVPRPNDDHPTSFTAGPVVSPKTTSFQHRLASDGRLSRPISPPSSPKLSLTFNNVSKSKLETPSSTPTTRIMESPSRSLNSPRSPACFQLTPSILISPSKPTPQHVPAAVSPKDSLMIPRSPSLSTSRVPIDTKSSWPARLQTTKTTTRSMSTQRLRSPSSPSSRPLISSPLRICESYCGQNLSSSLPVSKFSSFQQEFGRQLSAGARLIGSRYSEDSEDDLFTDDEHTFYNGLGNTPLSSTTSVFQFDSESPLTPTQKDGIESDPILVSPLLPPTLRPSADNSELVTGSVTCPPSQHHPSSTMDYEPIKPSCSTTAQLPIHNRPRAKRPASFAGCTTTAL